MVLRTHGPADLFEDYKLVLHTSSYDAQRARVFHVCGEFLPWGLSFYLEPGDYSSWPKVMLLDL